MSTTSTCGIPSAGMLSRNVHPTLTSTSMHNLTGCRWQVRVILLILQLEAAARDRVQRSDRQEDEAQIPSDLQIFLHSTAQFGPASMRELMVRQRSCLLCGPSSSCVQANQQTTMSSTIKVNRPRLQSAHSLPLCAVDSRLAACHDARHSHPRSYSKGQLHKPPALHTSRFVTS